MPVAIYARISSDRNETGATDRQIDLCHDLLATRPDLTLYSNMSADKSLGGYRGGFADDGISAASGKHRPAWAEVEKLVLAGKIDGVVAYAPDRIHRRTLEMITFIARVSNAKRGLTLYFVNGTDQDFSSPNGRLVASLLSVFAGHEVEMLTQRVVDEKKEAAEDGRWNGGRAPLGYMAVRPKKSIPDGNGGMIQIDDENAKKVLVQNPVVAGPLRDAINEYLRGKSLITCLEEFRAATGLATEYTSFKGSLCSPSIAGQRMHFPQAKRAGRSVHKLYTTPRLLEEEAMFYPAKWEPIISIATWKQLRDQLVNNSDKLRGKKPVISLLAGMVFCAACGATMGNDGTSYRVKGDPESGIKHYPTYRCNGSNHGCGKMRIGASLLDPFITVEFRKVLERSLAQQRFACDCSF
ncbi:recombinase family protein [Arthrobacter sp. 1P04PC]|uniref:recombinase family protein n=1 Tax=unclassified Arthrobacter TaxID=235627 RepID=UPI00399F3277